jgi:beta-lactam-binding protein with PASTA domain
MERQCTRDTKDCGVAKSKCGIATSSLLSFARYVAVFALALGCFATTWASTTQGLYSFDTIASTGGQFVKLAGSPTSFEAPSINSSGTVAFPCFDEQGATLCTGTGDGVAHIAASTESNSFTFLGGIHIDDAGNVTGTRQQTGPAYSLSQWNAPITTQTQFASGRFISPPPTTPAAQYLSVDFDAVFGNIGANNKGQIVFAGLDRHALLNINPTEQCTQATCLATPTNSVATALKFNELPISNPVRPLIADDGTVVVRYKGSTIVPPIQPTTTTSAIRAYNYALTTATTVADEATGLWAAASLGLSPGITSHGFSTSGDAIAFSGNRKLGQGIYLAVFRNGTAFDLIRVAGEGQPDLGFLRDFNENSTPIQFLSFDQDSRVGVVHRSAGAATGVGDIYLVTFIGTPSLSSDDPAATTTKQAVNNQQYIPGSVFSAQRGLWTTKIHVIDSASITGALPPNCTSGGLVTYCADIPMKVIQEGDDIPGEDGFTVDTAPPTSSSTIQVYDPIALPLNATGDTDVNRSNHQIAFLVSANVGANQFVLRASQTDSCMLPVTRLPQGSALSGAINAPWSASIYDGSNICPIQIKGCALTTLATVLNYAASSPGKDGDTLPTDPGELNTLLNNNLSLGGFENSPKFTVVNLPSCSAGPPNTASGNKDRDVVWSTATGIAVHNNNAAGSKSMVWSNTGNGLLGSNYSNLADPGYSQLRTNLCTNQAPVVIGVNLGATKVPKAKPNAPSHFVVATGIVNGQVLIADPGHFANYVLETSYTLNDAGNRFVVRGHISDPTDLSSVLLNTSDNVVLDIVDGNGRHATYDPTTGIPAQDIPNSAAYGDGNDDPSGTSGPEFTKVVEIQTPPQGMYTVNVTSVDGSAFSVSIVFRDQQGNPQPALGFQGNVSAGATSSFGVSVQSNGSGITIVPIGGISVPNVIGLTQSAATSAITGAGLALGMVTAQSSATIPSGLVISETPTAGTTVASGSAINLVVSSGPASVSVPNVVGLTQAAATTAITGSGLTLGTVTQQSSATVASGLVINESPLAGASVASGSAVNIVVSSGPGPVAVPNVVGLTQAAATTAITSAGLTLGTVTQQSSATVAAGLVISESPTAGTSVTAKSVVNLIVSSGAANVSVPNVVGLTQAQATTAITAAGLTLGSITTQSSATIAAGLVISESPTAGTSVAAKSAVSLVVSSGAAPVAVPNVVGLTQAAATSAITGTGLILGTVTTQSSATVAAGLVIGESPTAGTSVTAKSAVSLIVSSGAAPVAVPNVVGLTQAAATTALSSAGLTLGAVTTQSSATVAAGFVISESPAAGASVAAKTAVSLVVSSGPAPVSVPNVVGSTQGAATTAITNAGLVVGAVTNQSSSTIAAGIVISESPAAGTSVAAKSAVSLVVSSGSLIGDLNGDGAVNCADLSIIKASFGKKVGQAGFDVRADVNKDGVVNILDLSAEARLMPAGTSCN